MSFVKSPTSVLIAQGKFVGPRIPWERFQQISNDLSLVKSFQKYSLKPAKYDEYK